MTSTIFTEDTISPYQVLQYDDYLHFIQSSDIIHAYVNTIFGDVISISSTIRFFFKNNDEPHTIIYINELRKYYPNAFSITIYYRDPAKYIDFKKPILINQYSKPIPGLHVKLIIIDSKYDVYNKKKCIFGIIHL